MLSLFYILTRVFFYLESFSFLSVFLSPFSPHALYPHLPCDSLIRARVYSILQVQSTTLEIFFVEFHFVSVCIEHRAFVYTVAN